MNESNGMSKKKTEHYVNNRELLEAMIVYRSKVENSFLQKYDRKPTKEDREIGRAHV